MEITVPVLKEKLLFVAGMLAVIAPVTKTEIDDKFAVTLRTIADNEAALAFVAPIIDKIYHAITGTPHLPDDVVAAIKQAVSEANAMDH